MAIDVTHPSRGCVVVNVIPPTACFAFVVRRMWPRSVPANTVALLIGETAIALMRPPSGARELGTLLQLAPKAAPRYRYSPPSQITFDTGSCVNGAMNR